MPYPIESQSIASSLARQIAQGTDVPEVPDKETWLAMTPDERMDMVCAFHAVLGVGRLQNVFPDPAPGYAANTCMDTHGYSM
jgi:hypothetical protein